MLCVQNSPQIQQDNEEGENIEKKGHYQGIQNKESKKKTSARRK